MTTNSGKRKILLYIKHLQNAQKLLKSLPNKYFRDAGMNRMLHEHEQILEKLEKEIAPINHLEQEEGE